MVVIDQFNLVAFGRNDRDAKTAFSRQLKQMAARKHVVVVVLYQTTGESERSKGADAAGIRELRIPKISDYSETIALVQDSSIVFGFDAVLWKDESTSRYRGKALLVVLKGRDGGEGSETELEWMPNDGIIRPRVATDLF
jgi:replicative DNA helicase